MSYFAVFREPGPAWDRARPMRRQDGWAAHAGFMDALAAEGFVVLGGPLGAGETKFLIVVNAADEGAVRARLAEDPWEPSRWLRTVAIERWEILLRHASG
ncbi:MAG TPA: hypothetical protein VKW09_01250 [bacterium]|nr:hypothetical protein [bacterium]